jgi:ubiquinone/menaquinone biosynthesis C-methylase UbiE
MSEGRRAVNAQPPDFELRRLAQEVGMDWAYGPYYDEAESTMDSQWEGEIWPFIRGCDFTFTVELAGGHGRNTEKLRHLARTLYVVDIREENVLFLEERFQHAKNVSVVRNNGIDLAGIGDAQATFVYSWDSMVHFDSDVVRAYLREFRRVLKEGGYGFCHYSNVDSDPTGSYVDHPGWRNFMSTKLFEHYLRKERLEPVRTRTVKLDPSSATSDGMTLFTTR